MSALLRVFSNSIFFIVVAKYLGVSDFGLLTFGVSLSGMISVVSEFGYSLMTIRDIPQKRFDENIYLFNTFIQKTAILILVGIAGFAYLTLTYDGDKVTIGYLFVMNGLLLSVYSYCQAILKSKNRFELEFSVVLLNALLLISIILGIYILNWSIFVVCKVYIAISVFKLLMVSSLVYRLLNWGKMTWNAAVQKYLFKNSWSFGLHYVIGVFYFTIDVQLLAYFFDEAEVGLYQSAFRIVMLALILADLTSQAFLPYLSKLIVENKKEFTKIFLLLEESLILLSGMGLFILFIIRYYIVDLVYNQSYFSSVTLYFPLIIMAIMRVSAVFYGIVLTVSDKQNIRVLSVFISLIVSFCANIYLIPRYGAIGAAWASVLTHIVLLSTYIYFSNKHVAKLLNANITIYHFIFVAGLSIAAYFDNMLIAFLIFIVLLIISYFMFIGKKKHIEVLSKLNIRA